MEKKFCQNCTAMFEQTYGSTITYQESMCELAELPMVFFSESVKTISLSSAKRFIIISKCLNRYNTNLDLTLHQ